MKYKLFFLMSIAAAFAVSSTTAIAQTPLGQFSSWVALTHTDANGKYCFAISRPQKYEPESQPPEKRHGTVVFFVTNRPSKGERQEPSVRVGYTFKPNSTVNVEVDGKNFTMFTHGDSAWMEEDGGQGESQLIEAMKAGNTLIVSGESSRPTKTKYTFSLSGVTAAINAIDKNCP